MPTSLVVRGSFRGDRVGPYRVSPSGEVVAGRAAEAGLALAGADVPRVVARILQFGGEWFLTIGSTARATITNSWVSAEFRGGARMLLPPGVTSAVWALEGITLEFEISSVVDDDLPVLEPEAEPLRRDRLRAWGPTALPLRADRIEQDHPIEFRPALRHLIAVTFRHLLEPGIPRPALPYAAAAAELGREPNDIAQAIQRARRRVNLMLPPHARLDDADAFGDYVVRKARLVGLEDL